MAEKNGRGVIYIRWGTGNDAILRRSTDSLHKHHPELPAKAFTLNDGSLLDKAAMCDLSPYAETLYLDVDTIVMGRLDFGFEQAARRGVACAICECPWLRRYGIAGDLVEFNTGVLFFTEKAAPLFDRWKVLAATMESSIEFYRNGKLKRMPENDQASFAQAVVDTDSAPFILPQNWNLRPQWQTSFFGPLKVWHDYRDVPAAVREFSDRQSDPTAIVDYHEVKWGRSTSPGLRLNLSPEPLEGFASAESFPLVVDESRVGDETCAEIVSLHQLQKFPHHKTAEVIFEWSRALEPGGTLRLSVPDAEWIARKLLERDARYPLESYLMGSQAEGERNGAIFNRDGLRLLMLQAGLRKIKPWKAEEGVASLPVSLNLEGTKPEQTEVKNTCAILSSPRFGPVSHFSAASAAFLRLGIQYQVDGGPYWQQTLAMMLEAAAKCHEFIITCDFDTLFIAQHVRELYRLIRDNPHADAICATEMRREDCAPLLTMVDAEGNGTTKVAATVMDEEIVPIRSGHFGLTIIRASSLAKLPHPWFVGVPGKTGRWDADRIDPDVAFWLRWGEAGLTVFTAPFVGVGHAQYVASWCGANWKVHHQPMTEWQSKGVPLEARQ